MNFVKKSGIILSSLFVAINLVSCSPAHSGSKNRRVQKHTHISQPKKIEVSHVSSDFSQNKPVSWNQPSGGPYPTLHSGENIWIDVSVKDQRVYIKNGDNTIYTMIVSTGKDSSPQTTTPTGTYYVQSERGTWFYSPQYDEGAEYWVSWKNHGEFLFHSVPMNQDREVLTADADRLGHKDSHGCIHLTVPDARWIYEHIPFNTKVVIH